MSRLRLALRTGAFLLAAALALPLLASPAAAQYFGRNKVQYDDFDFRVLKTEHFDIYYYDQEEQAVRDAARMAERWYARLSTVLGHTFDERKSIIFYADDADFKQTNVVSGSIGEGTQGITEGLKQRIVMPIGASYEETDHVLGHELVHQFQYDLSTRGGSFANFVRLPLWIVEGMAEYFSVGRTDAHTAMWMRDAALRDAFPTLEDLSSNPRYFPYRYGQAFWAYVGGTYGDEAAVQLFRNALVSPLDSAIVSVTGLDDEAFSEAWAEAVKTAYVPIAQGRALPRTRTDFLEDPAERFDSLGVADAPGRRILAKSTGSGDMNVAPQLSPDGKYVAFLSERDLFGIDLFLADAETGEILKKLESVGLNQHFDALRFINSAGTWSPDGRKFAYVVYADGDNEIAILDVASRNVERRVKVAGVGALKDPAWSPDGRTIAFTGISGGISDLYLVDVDGGTARQLTNDRYADIQPVWSPDGRRIAFSSDRGPGTSFDRLTFAEPRLALYDLDSGEIETLTLFPDAKHVNPAWAPDGESLYFISDRDGVSNVYRYALDDAAVYQVTDLASGVSGITALSPALSVAQQTGRVAFSAFEAQTYNVYALEAAEAQGTPVEPGATPGVEGVAVLPPLDALGRGLVTAYLNDAQTGLPDTRAFPTTPYRPKLTLDYVTQPTVGAGYDPYSGVGVAGGIALLFSDQLGDHFVGAQIQANGSFQDIGGQVTYVNRERRLNWGASTGHIPYLQVLAANTNNDPFLDLIYYRQFNTQAAALAEYPLSTTRRFEGQLGARRIGYGVEVRESNPNGSYDTRGISADELGLETLYLAEASAAFVGDYANFGFTSPVQGGRYRFGVSGSAGSLAFAGVTADYRRYFFVPRWLTVAVRGLHIGRYGPDRADENLRPYYLGFGTLVRGYGFRQLEDQVVTFPGGGGATQYDLFQDRLFGTSLGVANVELRVPLVGVEEFGLINFGYLPTELTLFGDAGTSWGQTPTNSFFFNGSGQREEIQIGQRFSDQKPLFSVGASLRVNVLGAIILEPYYAIPLSSAEAFRFDSSIGENGGFVSLGSFRPEPRFGLNLSPGW